MAAARDPVADAGAAARNAMLDPVTLEEELITESYAHDHYGRAPGSRG